MRKGIRRASGIGLVAALAFGLYMILTPATAVGKGKPKPPSCDCPETIETPFGTCVLDSCGFDCTYVCPFPG